MVTHNEIDLKKEDNIRNNLKNEDNFRKEDSLEMKTHTAPPLRPSVVLVII